MGSGKIFFDRISQYFYVMLETNFQPFPELKTERLLLRRMAADDTAALFVLRSNNTVMQHIDRPPASTIAEVEALMQSIENNLETGNGVLWAIAFKNDPTTLIGTICYWQISKENYRAETGYMLHPDHWRKGIMKEALLKVIEYGFDTMKLHSIEARINAKNTASAAVLESTGFVREAYFKEDCFYDGKFLDTAVYSRLR